MGLPTGFWARRRCFGLREQLDRGCFPAAPGLRHLHAHGLPGLELVDARPPQRRHMDEDVLAAVIRYDKAEAVRRVVPFDDAIDRLGGAGSFLFPMRRPAVARRPRRRGRGVELQHLGGSAAFRSLRPLDRDPGAVGRLAKARALEHGERQKHIARAVIRYDEAESLAAIEPLDLA